MGLAEVTAATKFSFAVPPKYVEYKSEFPARFSLATKASNPPPLLSWIGVTTGRFVDEVNPVT